MKLRFWLAVLLLLVTSLAWAPASSAQSIESTPSFVPDEVLVTLRPGYRLTSVGRVFDPLGRELRAGLHPGLISAESLDRSGSVELLRLRPGSDVHTSVTALHGNPAVLRAEPNYVRMLLREPGDPAFSQQWGMRKILAPEAWDITTGSDQIVIALLDTGVSPSHEDLRDKLVSGFNAITGSGDFGDDEGHGTYTAGVAAASTDNGTGVAGVCWNCRIMPIKVLDSHGIGSSASLVKGIRYAADNGARIISMSLGGAERSQAEEDAVNYAYSKGALIIAASGNSGGKGNPTIYPAAFDHVLAVAATGNTDQVTGFSSYGPYVDIAAPGVGIWSTLWQDGSDTYGVANGTSASCPHVAGVAGLILSIWPELSPDHLAQILMATADDIGVPGRDDYNGYGRLNAFRAVSAARDRQIPDLPKPPEPRGNPAFIPVGPPADPSIAYFPETGHTLRGAFKSFWEQNGGLEVFGFPISEEFSEQTAEGTYIVQYFERERFEYHPENAPPYHVLLGRLGDTVLLDQGRNWFTFPKGQEVAGCRHFAETGHTVCEPFLSYWRNHGLQFDGQPGFSEVESLALFGMPLSEPQMETNKAGDTVLTQWFERARLEYHPNNPPEYQVLLGLLGSELVDSRAWR
ncbi:MAG: peptidase S8 [Herpetosiphonaceae bacterium]|nr:MAG: peptidase S8 [Herpetosiphonaceae bacterium]